jgi:hypothetical protein
VKYASILGLLRAPGTLVRTYGLRGTVRRGTHEMRKRLGAFQARPNTSYGDRGRRAVAYRPSGELGRLPVERLDAIVDRGRRVRDGYFEAFGHDWRPLPDAALRWHEHPHVEHRFPLVKWWRVPLTVPGVDIKDLWEPARFGWAYDLTRAYAVTGDVTFAEAFHQRLAEWIEANPPFDGPQWACGQETAIRALAVLHAEDGLPSLRQDANASRRLIALLAWSGERIWDAIGYGISQRNNHGISESAGLIHLGIRLREAHPRARTWLAAGVRLIEEQIRDQFAQDGWYAQHSFTYARVALEQALYAQRALSFIGRTLSVQALSRLDAGIGLIASLIDARCGELPNHGANDGARVLPLSTARYRDFRPLLTLAALVRGTPLPMDVSPDGDTLAWIGGRLPPPAAARTDGVAEGSSGWASARVGRCMIFVRAGGYRHRPSHLDSLHVDVRIDGREFIVDPGTYSYNGSMPWRNALAVAALHNGPIIDGMEPARRGPRFLWLSWPSARVSTVEFAQERARIVVERTGIVRREILVHSQGVRIIDRPLQSRVKSIQVTWLLHPDADRDSIWAEHAKWIEACEGSAIGWYSPTYGQRLRSCAVRIVVTNGAERAFIETEIRAPSMPGRVCGQLSDGMR